MRADGHHITDGARSAWLPAGAAAAILLVGLCLSISAGAEPAAARAGNGGVVVVRSIEFVGNYTFDDKALSRKIDFKVGDYLDPILAETGRRAIAEHYRKKGFAYVRVLLNNAALAEGRVIYIVEQGPQIQIRSVTFKGNRSIKSDDLAAAVKTGTRSWVVKPVFYDKERLDQDVEALRKIYYGKGFLDHRIEVLGENHIVFVIEEGPQYRVGQIVVSGNTRYDRAAVLEGLELNSGDVYLQQEAQAHAKRILKLYRENGFIDADVEQRAEFVGPAAPGIVNLVFDIIEGDQFRIGAIEITGNDNTHDRVVRHILDEYGFSPGELYNADMAPGEGGGKLEDYIKRLTLAEQAIIRPATSQEQGPSRDVSVDIKEGLTGMWNPGIGIGSDSGVIGRLIYQQRNTDVTDWPESFGEFLTMRAFRGAGQTMRVALEPGTEVSQYSVSFTEPYLNDRPTSLDLVGSSYQRFRESFDEKRLRGYLGFEQRLKEDWRRTYNFRAENVDVGSVDLDAPSEIYRVKGSNALYGVGLGFGRNRTDDRFLPARGYVFNAGYEQVTGEQDFGLLTGVFVRYKTLHEDLLERKTVLATKVRTGTVVGDAPPFEKFYGGGTGTYGIRGFRYRGVSPRGLQTNVANPRRKDPVGSDWIFIATGEVSVPLVGENLFALFFVDSGTVQTGGYRGSVGTGIQVQIPQLFGPVPMRFEIAAPFMKDKQDELETFSFSVGELWF